MVISRMNDFQRKSVEPIITELVSKEKNFVAARLIGTVLYLKKEGYLCTEQGSVLLSSTFPKDDPMYEAVEKNFKNIGTDETKLFLELLKKITEYDISRYNYLEILDIAISLSAEMQTRIAYLTRKSKNVFLQPTEFGQLAERLLNIQGETILNPFADLMSYATDMHQWSQFTEIIKESEDSPIKEISMFRVALAEKAKCDIISDWPNDKYDVMVSTFPLMRWSRVEDFSENPYTTCLERFEECTNSKGRLFCIVFPSLLSDSSYKKLREELTEKNYVDAVIELPSGLLMPYTSVQCIVLVLDKTRNTNAPIKMVNASQMLLEDKRLDVEEVVATAVNDTSSDKYIAVTREEIRNKEYYWTPEIYKRQEYPEGYEVVLLNSILEPIRPKRNFSEKQGRVVKISDLSTNISNYTKDDFNVVDDLSGTIKVTESVLLMSSMNDIRPTYCNATPSQPLFVSKWIMAFRITAEWVHPMYLCLEISRRIKRKRGPFLIPQKMILFTNVAFPLIGTQQSYEIAKNLYQEALNNYRQAIIKEYGLQEIIDNLKSEYINIVRTRKHDMAPHIREINNIQQLMEYYTENEEGLSEEYKEKIVHLAYRLKDALTNLNGFVDIFSSEEEFGKPEPIDIEDILTDYYNDEPDFGEEYIEVSYDKEALEEYDLPLVKRGMKLPISNSEGKIVEWHTFEYMISHFGPFWVNIAKIDLRRLFDGIIDNVSRHGFTDEDKRDDYMIEIRLTVDADRDMFQIDFRNNGNPFPKEMDKKNYGKLGEKAGSTAGTGRGGYTVRSIVEHYNGDYDVFMDGDWCVVRIFLPIYKEYYEQSHEKDV